LISTGSEVHLVLEAAENLESDGVSVRVISIHAWNYLKNRVLNTKKVVPSDVKARISVEAGATFGWHKWVGSDGVTIGLDRLEFQRRIKTLTVISALRLKITEKAKETYQLSCFGGSVLWMVVKVMSSIGFSSPMNSSIDD
jgi:transketolase